MNIIEAIKSGKRFKRKIWNRKFHSANDLPTLLSEDIVADDWVIEEQKIELSWNEIEKAIKGWMSFCVSAKVPYTPNPFYLEIKRDLGFTDG